MSNNWSIVVQGSDHRRLRCIDSSCTLSYQNCLATLQRYYVHFSWQRVWYWHRLEHGHLLKFIHTTNCKRKRSENDYGRNLGYRIFGCWSIGVCPDLGNTHSFQETREQSKKYECWTFGVQSFSRAEYETKQVPALMEPAFFNWASFLTCKSI